MDERTINNIATIVVFAALLLALYWMGAGGFSAVALFVLANLEERESED